MIQSDNILSSDKIVSLGLVEILKEASEFIHAVHIGTVPNIRYPLVDELDGFAEMLKTKDND